MVIYLAWPCLFSLALCFHAILKKHQSAESSSLEWSFSVCGELEKPGELEKALHLKFMDHVTLVTGTIYIKMDVFSFEQWFSY